ncbi:MAG: DUF4384 domain-containing protein [Thermodesulfobacteriota bacterium]
MNPRIPSHCLFLLSLIALSAVTIPPGRSDAADPPQYQEKRSCIQAVDGYAYLSENMTLAETRSAAFANARRQALEAAKTFIRSKTKVTNFMLDYDTIWSDSEGAVTVIEQKDIGIEDNKRYHVWIKADVEYALKPKQGATPAAAAEGDRNAPLTVKLWTPEKNYREGQKIEIFLQGNRDFYAKIVDITSSGEIIQLLPNNFRKTNFFKANEIYKIPNEEDQFDMTVAPPFGQDKIIAYVSELPLGDVAMEPMAQGGLNQYRGTEESLGVQTRGIFLGAKNASPVKPGSPAGKQSPPDKPGQQEVSGVEFFEATWIVSTGE